MKISKLVIGLFLISIATSSFAQIDTIYNLGNQKNRLTIDDIEQRIKSLEETMKNDTIDWIVRFEVTHEEKKKDTLIQYGTINLIAESLLSEEEKMESKLNKEIPEFNFVDIEGKIIASNQYSGKVILINFWFTKCPPCIAEIPYLNQIKNDYQNLDIEFISMAPEDSIEVQKFLERYEFQFRHIPDADSFLKKFGVGFPKNILVDKKGIIRYIGGGIISGLVEEGDENIIEKNQISWDELRIKIDKLLGE